jgi:hypothetical protein
MTPSPTCLGELELLVTEVGDELEGTAESGDEPGKPVSTALSGRFTLAS